MGEGCRIGARRLRGAAIVAALDGRTEWPLEISRASWQFSISSAMCINQSSTSQAALAIAFFRASFAIAAGWPAHTNHARTRRRDEERPDEEKEGCC